MALSSELISQFVQVTKEEKQNKETTVYGTIKETDHGTYVQLDGSTLLTPIATSADVRDGERVTVMIKDHRAIVTGNLTSPSARVADVEAISDELVICGQLIANKVDTEVLDAESARITALEADNATINGKLTANEAEIKDLKANKIDASVVEAEYATIKTLDAASARITELEADNVEINGKLTANEAEIKDLKANKIDASVVEAEYATIDSLESVDAHIQNLEALYGEFHDLTTDRLTATEASIQDLETKKLNADEAEVKYANIDFANIGEAAIKKVFSDSGIIADLVVSEGKITGELVGVTIKGDLIEAGTLKADRLVVLGSDGNYYKINTDFDAEAMNGIEPVEEDQIHGSTLIKKSIVAEKIAVDDLVAFGATIGGFHIGDDAIYSDVKTSATNTTRGIYMDKSGQLSVGDANNYLRYYKDQNGNYKLEISASSMVIESGSGGSSGSTTIEDALNALRGETTALKEEVATVKDEVTTLLRIESSRGTVFKNDQISTVLSAVIYRGSTVIRDIDTLHSIMGSSAYLEWSWQHLNDDDYGIISADDSRIGNGGFTFTLSPDDVNTKVTFMCTLNT